MLWLTLVVNLNNVVSGVPRGSVLEAVNVPSPRLGILTKSWQAFHDRLLLERCIRGFVLSVCEYCSDV